MIKRNIKKNKVMASTLFDGSNSCDKDVIAGEFVDFYKTLLGVGMERICIDVEVISLGPTVRDENVDGLIRDVSMEEIRNALFGIEDDKAPGPDGFGAAFFKKSWDIVGYDVCAAVLEFFLGVVGC